MSAEIAVPAIASKRMQYLRVEDHAEPLLVDTCDTVPRPPGQFVILTGGRLLLAQLEHVPHSNPAMVHIASDHRTLPRNRLDIRGRVIGKWVAA
jgi:hypothetical protein